MIDTLIRFLSDYERNGLLLIFLHVVQIVKKENIEEAIFQYHRICIACDLITPLLIFQLFHLFNLFKNLRSILLTSLDKTGTIILTLDS